MINWNNLNDALSYIDKAEIELEDFRDSLEDDNINQWKVNYVRNKLSDLYNKLLDIKIRLKNG